MYIYNFPKKLIFIILNNKYFIRFLVNNNLTIILYILGLILIKSDNRNKVNTPNKYKLLCLDRPIFNADIDALASINKEFGFINIPKEYFLFLLKGLYPDKVYMHQNYYKESLDSKPYMAYRKTIYYIINKLIKKYNIDGIVSANYNYSWQQEIAIFCSKEEKIKFIVILKEGINTLGADGEDNLVSTIKYFKRYTNNRFIGDLIFVYNDLIREALIRSNIQGISQEKIIVSGIPRMDKYYNMPKNNNNVITFFSFSIEDKSRHLNLTLKEFNQIKILSDRYHLEIIKFAILNKEYKLTIKTKANNKYVDEIKKLIINNNINITPNIEITNKGQAHDLIKNSSIVIGFNSTTLQESLVADRKVICCDFRGTKIKDQFASYENIIYYFDNYKKLDKLIKFGNNKSISIKNKNLYLKNNLGNNSGNSSNKILKEIQRSL